MKKFILYSSIFAIALSATQVFGQGTATNNSGPDATSTISTQSSQQTTTDTKARTLTIESLEKALGTYALKLGISPDGDPLPTGSDPSNYAKFASTMTTIVESIVNGTEIPKNITPFFQLFSSIAIGVTNANLSEILKNNNLPTLSLPTSYAETVKTGLQEFSGNIAKESTDNKAAVIALLSEATNVQTNPNVASIFKEGGSSINTLISNVTQNLGKATKPTLGNVSQTIGSYANISAAVMANSSKDSDAYTKAKANLTKILTIANKVQVSLPGLNLPKEVLEDSNIKGLFDTNKTISSSTQPNSPAIPGQQTNTPATTQNQTSGQPAFSQTGSVY